MAVRKRGSRCTPAPIPNSEQAARFGLTAGEDGQYRIDAAQAMAIFGIKNEDHFDIGFHGLIAAAFDHFGLDEIIDRRIGKVAHNAVLNSGAGVRAMVMQLLGAPYQSLLNVSSCFSKMPVGVLLRQPVQPEDLGRHVLSRLLDDIYDYGPRRLFTECSAQVLSVPGLKVTEAHIDSTGYHYDGRVKEDDECELKITHGYSRDCHPDLPQVILPGIVDGKSGIPLMTEAVSGNVNDNASFLKVMESWHGLREVMADLEYLVGDSPACTPDILGKARSNGIHVITRVPDKYAFVKELFRTVKDEEFVPLYADEPCGSLGRWCGTATVGGTELKLLMIDNEKLRPQKEQTVRRHAQKELEKLRTLFGKLETRPAACMEDAVRNFEAVAKKCRLCRVDSVSYEELWKNAKRGRPRKNAAPEDRVLEGVKVHVTFSVDEDRVKKAVTDEIRYVIATTDTEKDWTMAELRAAFMGQAKIERMWRVSKDPSILPDAIYLKKPSRICALMWLLSLALLVFAATEYLVRRAGKATGLSSRGIYDDDALLHREEEQERMPLYGKKNLPAAPVRQKPDYAGALTLLALKRYIQERKIGINVRGTSVTVTGVTRNLAVLLATMGMEWCRYYMDDTYSYNEVMRLYGDS